MEPPRFLALFNQPLPKQTVGRRDVTNVPDQALAMLNDPFVIEMARIWSNQLITDGANSVEERAAHMIQTALSRPAHSQEIASLSSLVRRLATPRSHLRQTVEGSHRRQTVDEVESSQHHQTVDQGSEESDILKRAAVWQDAAHAVFNLKEFLYVPVDR